MTPDLFVQGFPGGRSAYQALQNAGSLDQLPGGHRLSRPGEAAALRKSLQIQDALVEDLLQAAEVEIVGKDRLLLGSEGDHRGADLVCKEQQDQGRQAEQVVFPATQDLAPAWCRQRPVVRLDRRMLSRCLNPGQGRCRDRRSVRREKRVGATIAADKVGRGPGLLRGEADRWECCPFGPWSGKKQRGQPAVCPLHAAKWAAKVVSRLSRRSGGS